MSDQEQAVLDAGDISLYFTGEQIVSHDGLSQYSRHSPSAGHSACGLAALNCVRFTFEKHNDGVTGEDLIRCLSSRQGAEEIVSICELWNNPSHLDAEDILKVPYFSDSVNLVETYYELCELASFRTILLALQRLSTLSAAIITKPPEIVACMKLPTTFGDVFLVFDSHIRPNHPNGAGFIFNPSIEAAANYLSRLFWVDKPSTIKDDSYGFHMDLIRQFCGYIIVPKSSLKGNLALTKSLLDASIRILALTTELADSKATISSIRAELQRARCNEPPHVTRNLTRAEKQHDSLRNPRKGKVASNSGEHVMHGPYGTAKNSDRTGSCSKNGGKSVSGTFLSASGFRAPRQAENNDHCAAQPQEDLKREDQGGFNGKRWLASGEKFPPDRPTSFTCMSCPKTGLGRDMVWISVCRHRFCNDCLREYVLSSLRQNSFPISCPLCAAWDNFSSESGFIDSKILKQINIAEEDYQVFQEWQANIPLKVAPERRHDRRMPSETETLCSMSFAQVVSKGAAAKRQ